MSVQRVILRETPENWTAYISSGICHGHAQSDPSMTLARVKIALDIAGVVFTRLTRELAGS